MCIRDSLNVGRIDGGSNTNVVPGKVVLKIDRRLVPEEDIGVVEAEVRALVDALRGHAEQLFGTTIEVSGSPLYADVRLYGERAIPAVMYGAGPRTVLESNAKRADEHVVLEDLRRATKVVARTLLDLLR